MTLTLCIFFNRKKLQLFPNILKNRYKYPYKGKNNYTIKFDMQKGKSILCQIQKTKTQKNYRAST